MRLDTNKMEKTVKNTNTGRLNNTFLSNQQVTEEIKREIKKISRNKWQWKYNNQNLWDSANAALRGKFIAIQHYLKKQEKHWIDNPTLHLKQLEKGEQQQQQQQKTHKINRRK